METANIKIIEQPKYVGGFRIVSDDLGSVTFMLQKKPNRIHIFFCKILLGWVWVQNK